MAVCRNTAVLTLTLYFHTMTLLQLTQSTDQCQRLKGSLLTLFELQTWLNENTRLPCNLQGSDNRKRVDVSVSFDDLQTGKTTDLVTLSVVPRSGDTAYDYECAKRLFGDPAPPSPQHQGEHWILSTKDWPFLTVEIVAEHIRNQGASSNAVPKAVEQQLSHFFPDVDYKELLFWHRENLLTLDKQPEGTTMLRAIMYSKQIASDAAKVLPPSDFVPY